jgi:hypothetical protein
MRAFVKKFRRGVETYVNPNRFTQSPSKESPGNSENTKEIASDLQQTVETLVPSSGMQISPSGARSHRHQLILVLN